MAESNLLGKIKGNTIDFRGLEQVVSRKDYTILSPMLLYIY